MTSWDDPPVFGPRGEVPPVRTEPILISEGFALRIAPVPLKWLGELAVNKILDAEVQPDVELESARSWLMETYPSKEVWRLSRNATASNVWQAGRFSALMATLPSLLYARRAYRGKANTLMREVVLLRLRRYFYWEREDALTRVGAGGSGKISRKVTVRTQRDGVSRNYHVPRCGGDRSASRGQN